MKKVGLILLALLAACTSKDDSSGNQKDVVMFPFSHTTFSWKGIEKEDPVLKAKFIKQAPVLLKNEYGFYGNEYHPMKEFGNACHIMDINNDGINDVIYTGSTGGEGREVNIFLNTPSGLKSILKRNQYIEKLEFKDNQLFRIYIEDDGCCDAYVNFNSVYQVSYNEKIPQFTVVYLTANMNHAYMPKSYFNKPIYFEVLNDNYKMHMTPNVADTIIDDFTFPGSKFKTENTIDTLVKGAKGRAIASQTDSTGRVWWFVEIDPAYKLYGKQFYEQDFDPKLKSSRMGWISSRFVKRIDK